MTEAVDSDDVVDVDSDLDKGNGNKARPKWTILVELRAGLSIECMHNLSHSYKRWIRVKGSEEADFECSVLSRSANFRLEVQNQIACHCGQGGAKMPIYVTPPPKMKNSKNML